MYIYTHTYVHIYLPKFILAGKWFYGLNLKVLKTNIFKSINFEIKPNIDGHKMYILNAYICIFIEHYFKQMQCDVTVNDIKALNCDSVRNHFSFLHLCLTMADDRELAIKAAAMFVSFLCMYVSYELRTLIAPLCFAVAF